MPVATETGLRGGSRAALRHAGALLPHQGVGRVKELGVGHGLRRRRRKMKVVLFGPSAAPQIYIHLAKGTELHTLEGRQQVGRRHGGQPLPLGLQLRITVQTESR